MLHCAGQVGVDAVSESVDMVGHQAVGVDLDPETFLELAEQELVVQTIWVVAEDVLAVGAAMSEVLPAVGCDETQGSCHDAHHAQPLSHT